VSSSRGYLADVHVLDETEAAFSMAKFLHLEESKEYLNRDVVSLVTESGDGSIVDRENDELVTGNDAANLLAWLKMEIKGRR
jgi:hypothetical protein